MMKMFSWICSLVFRSARKRIARERFMLPKEWEIVRPILATYPLLVYVYFSILFLEGPRMSELRTARWLDLDLDAALWHKTTTKNGKRHLIALSECSCDLLRLLPRDGPYPFHGDPKKGGDANKPWSRTAVTHWWRKIRWEAGCPDLRIHDLRRSTGSWMAIDGENLKAIQDTLGHSSIEITAKHYAHLDLAAQRAAKERHAKRVFPVEVEVCP